MSKEIRANRKDNVWAKADRESQNCNSSPLKTFLESNNAITLPDILKLSAKKYGNSNCLGTRKLLERLNVEEGGKVLEKLVLGEYEWKSYIEVQNLVSQVAAALNTLELKRGDRVVIFAETRAEWFISAIGCLQQGLTVVTLYTNLCDSGLCHGIEETEVDTVFTSYDVLPTLLKILPKCDRVKNIIVFEDQLKGTGEIPKEFEHKIIPFQTLLTRGNVEELPIIKLDPDDDGIIMYTSGTTGNPKGVIISHNNMYYALLAYDMQTSYTSSDRYIAYLPLAHAMELFSEIALISIGVTIAYSSPLTLTNSSPKIARGTIGDAKIAKPTAVTTVPLILERIIKSVSQKVKQQGKLKSKIFKQALLYKQRNSNSLASRVVDMIIFDKVKAELGGSVRTMIVGSAPVSNETVSMIRAMFGCAVQTGYGCTETVACASSMDLDDKRIGHVGAPNPYVSIKLVDWEEGDFRTTDKPRPRGEIVIGGKCVTRGYFKLPEETKEAFYEEDGIRWFKTGDIGEFDETGVLYIIDRKKDLAKLKHGEYVSLGFIESRLKASPLIENICVFADPNENHTVAIVIPSISCLKKIAAYLEMSSDQTREELCRNEKLVNAFLAKLQSYGKNCGLTKWDIPQAIYLSTSQWTPDAGFVTAALKLKRRALQNEYDEQIKVLYNK